MLRLTELKLPLDHPPEALPAAIAERLGVGVEQLIAWKVSRRAHDARRKSAILMVYTVDVDVADEQAALDRKSTRLNSSHIPLSRMPSSA